MVQNQVHQPVRTSRNMAAFSRHSRKNNVGFLVIKFDDLSTGVIPVKNWHIEVQQDKIDPLFVLDCLFGFFYGGVPVEGLDYFDVELFQIDGAGH